MADLTTQVIDQDGLTPTYAACAAGGDKIHPGEDVFLNFKNTGGSPLTVTIVTPKVEDVSGSADLGVADVTVSVPATTGNVFVGPITTRLFGNPADSGKCAMTYSGVTSLTVAVLQVA